MPLDHSQVRSIVNANVEKMRWALQLQDWHIHVTHVHLDGDAIGDCRPEPTYQRAYIRIDSDGHDTEEKVLDTLRHEMLHLLDAEMETYRKAVSQLLPDDVFNALDEFFRRAVEGMVGRVERMLDYGLKIGVAEMCKIGELADGTGRQDG
jgi:hypothetical protein